MDDLTINDIIMYIPIQHIILSVILIIFSLWLKEFKPPIKRQWQSLFLLILSGTLSYFLLGKTLSDVLMGICISGLIYYKDKLVEEIKLLKNNLNLIELVVDKKDTKNKKENKDKNENNKGDEQ